MMHFIHAYTHLPPPPSPAPHARSGRSDAPLTASDIVAVITVAIALVNGHGAEALDLRHTAVRGELEVAVKALALGTLGLGLGLG